MDDEELLLAVLNTTPVEASGRQDLLAGAAGLTWLAERDLEASARERDALVAARDRLQHAVRRDGPNDVSDAELDGFLDGVSDVPVREDGVLAWRRRLPAGRALAARVVLAYEELERARPGRVRACASPDCERFLVDHSRANQAKWCSMATCGNRAKARRHYRRFAHGT